MIGKVSTQSTNNSIGSPIIITFGTISTLRMWSIGAEYY